MEIVKQNETFNLSETTDVFEMTGNATYETNGALNVYFTATRAGGDRVGDCHYHKYSENDYVNFNVNCAEENRDELTAYADTVIESVLRYLNTSN